MSKRSRASSSRSSSNAWVTNEGRKRLEKPPLPMIMERGVLTSRAKYQWAQELIVEQGWIEFAKIPEPAITQWVREFYANVPDSNDGKVFVRGKYVDFSVQAINDTYNLPNPSEEDDGYFQYRNNQPDLNTLVEALCPEGTNLNGKKKIQCNTLCYESNFLLHFISARIIPTTYFTEVSKERAILIHAILNSNKQVNVGRIINAELFSKQSRSWGFPHLITKMCRAAGIKPESSDVPIPPMGPIDEVALELWMEGDKRNLNPPEAADRRQARRSSNRNNKNVMMDLEDEVDRMHLTIGGMKLTQAEILANQKAMMKYQRHQEKVNRTMLQSLQYIAGQGQGSSSMQEFPTWPEEWNDPNFTNFPPEQ